jgi:formylglycine-generating enzyme required for sulfatase activity
MVVIPAGSFLMGSPRGEIGRTTDEAMANGEQRPMTLARPLAVGKYEVTFAEYDACVGDTAADRCSRRAEDPSNWGRGRRPVIMVSWNDAQQYVRWLSRRTGQRYRLLTEAEWEYAARAGTVTPFSFGATISTAQANYDGSNVYGLGVRGPYRQRTLEVGSLGRNGWGLYDMHGNAWEWVQDCYRGSYPPGPGDAGVAVEGGDCSLRVLRGGSWNYDPQFLRSANRSGNLPGHRYLNIGFRVARTPG